MYSSPSRDLWNCLWATFLQDYTLCSVTLLWVILYREGEVTYERLWVVFVICKNCWIFFTYCLSNQCELERRSSTIKHSASNTLSIIIMMERELSRTHDECEIVPSPSTKFICSYISFTLKVSYPPLQVDARGLIHWQTLNARVRTRIERYFELGVLLQDYLENKKSNSILNLYLGVQQRFHKLSKII